MNSTAQTLKLPELCCKFLNLQRNSRSSNPSTLRAYALDLRQAFQLDVLGDLVFSAQGQTSVEVRFTPKSTDKPSLPAQVDAAGLKRLLKRAQKGWSGLKPASRQRKTATLKSFCRWLYEEGLTDSNLGDQLHFPKVPKKIPHHLSPDEALSLISYLYKERDTEAGVDPRALPLTLLLYGGGLRLGEALGLKAQDLDLQEERIMVRGKGGKSRWVPLPSDVFAEIQRLSDPPRSSLWGDAPPSPRKAYDWIRGAGRRAGLQKDLHPHALRHSYATHLLLSGSNLRTLQDLLGHSSLSATERYTHITLDHLANTLESCHPLARKNKLG